MTPSPRSPRPARVRLSRTMSSLLRLSLPRDTQDDPHLSAAPAAGTSGARGILPSRWFRRARPDGLNPSTWVAGMSPRRVLLPLLLVVLLSQTACGLMAAVGGATFWQSQLIGAPSSVCSAVGMVTPEQNATQEEKEQYRLAWSKQTPCPFCFGYR